jgi:hypothetical protein
MSKMGLHDPFGYLKHKLWPKEGMRIKLAIWLPKINIQESPRFPCVKVACNISLKSSWWGLKFRFRPHLNQRSAHKIMGLQSCEVLILGILRFPLGSPETKCHLGASPVAKLRVYYKGEGGGFPQIRAMVSFVSPCLLVARSCTKGAQTTH